MDGMVVHQTSILGFQVFILQGVYVPKFTHGFQVSRAPIVCMVAKGRIVWVQNVSNAKIHHLSTVPKISMVVVISMDSRWKGVQLIYPPGN